MKGVTSSFQDGPSNHQHILQHINNRTGCSWFVVESPHTAEGQMVKKNNFITVVTIWLVLKTTVTYSGLRNYHIGEKNNNTLTWRIHMQYHKKNWPTNVRWSMCKQTLKDAESLWLTWTDNFSKSLSLFRGKGNMRTGCTEEQERAMEMENEGR